MLDCKTQAMDPTPEGDMDVTERVLLTGITGYIGQHCGAELLNQGYEVVGTVRSRARADAPDPRSPRSLPSTS